MRAAIPLAMTWALLLAGPAAAVEMLTREPPMGGLRERQQVYVDDHSCPSGQVKLVTGGNHVKVGGTKQIERSRACVPRPQ